MGIKDEVLSKLYSGIKVRVTTTEAKSALLDSPYFWNGKLINVETRSLGAGVHELRGTE